MKLLKFDNYDEYRAVQVQANVRKFQNVYVESEELRRVAEDCASRVPNGRFGLCHGVRNGFEVRILRRLLPNVDVRGTDISDTAASILHCMMWDMHQTKPEWLGQVDFMYSNSWDHTYDPALLFDSWSKCLSPQGRLYVAYTDKHGDGGVTEDTKYDVFGCSLDEFVTVLQRSLVLEDVLEIRPGLTLGRAVKKRLTYIRMGRFGKFLSAPLRSRRSVVLVLAPRPGAAAAETST